MSHALHGDLHQMGIMEQALREAGFTVGRRDVYPTVHEDDYDKVLRYLFNHRIEGWWNQERDLVERGIATQRQYDIALGRVPQGENIDV